MPETHNVGYVVDRDQSAVRSPGDLQQKLVLLWLQTSRNSGLLAELQKSANFRSKLGQKLNVVLFVCHGHQLRSRYIVTRYYFRWNVMA